MDKNYRRGILYVTRLDECVLGKFFILAQTRCVRMVCDFSRKRVDMNEKGIKVYSL